MGKPTAFKTDRFRKNRGGHSRWLVLSCEKCDQEIAVYQKDGPGVLKRLYLDRIVTSQRFKNLAQHPVAKMPPLICASCKTVLGMPIIYKKEKRVAFRLFVGAVGKKIVKGDRVEDIRPL